jgi:mannose-6-phosphate isomerase-like protein (cupin superfamily)
MNAPASSPGSPTGRGPVVRPPVHVQPKGWGHELWIHNDARYCGKLLFVKAGKRCSLHFHRKKYETFFVQSGRITMRLRHRDGREESFEMKKGDCLEIPQGTAHQFAALEDCELFEFSTQHFEDDSHRIEKGD